MGEIKSPTIHEHTFKVPQYQCRRRKIRRLVKKNDEKCKKIPKSKSAGVIAWFLSALLFFMVVAILAEQILNGGRAHKQALNRFMYYYRQHYHQIFHGSSDYCSQKLDTAAMFKSVRKADILHQSRVLSELELALRYSKNFTSIALVGPSGVGKSLSMRAVERSFPWPENVHAYAWNTHVPDISDKFAMMSLYADRLTACGRNLIVIENLRPEEYNTVQWLNKFFKDELQKQGPTDEKKQLVIIYVFTLDAYEQLAVYEKQREELQQLPDTLTLNFRQFGAKELEDCIRREAVAENVILSPRLIQNVVSTVDVQRSGCKNVRAKLLMFQ